MANKNNIFNSKIFIKKATTMVNCGHAVIVICDVHRLNLNKIETDLFFENYNLFLQKNPIFQHNKFQVVLIDGINQPFKMVKTPLIEIISQNQTLLDISQKLIDDQRLLMNTKNYKQFLDDFNKSKPFLNEQLEKVIEKTKTNLDPSKTTVLPNPQKVSSAYKDFDILTKEQISSFMFKPLNQDLATLIKKSNNNLNSTIRKSQIDLDYPELVENLPWKKK